MTTEQRPTSWWQTLPGILTAAGAVITAVTGLVIALNQAGLFKRPKEAAPDSGATTQAQAARGRATDPVEGSKAALPVAPGEKQWIDMKAVVTMKDGPALELDAPTLRNCISAVDGIQIVNGLGYPFSSMKSVDVLGANDPLAPGALATIRITLRDGKVVEGKTEANCGLFGYSGENKSSDFAFNKFTRIDFR
jgi:hypothetical protein